MVEKKRCATPHLAGLPGKRTPNFSRVAHVYRWAEYLTLGPLLRFTREHYLEDVSSAASALVLGDGDGRFLRRLLERAPRLHAVAVDSSPTMLRLLQQRCAFAEQRLETACGHVPPLPALCLEAVPDLVVTHFFLDCLAEPEIEALACVLAAHLAPGGRWLVSDFGIPGRRPWRWLGSALVRALYLAFGLLTGLAARRLPPIRPALLRAGFVRHKRWSMLFGLLYSEIWKLPLP